MTGPNTLSSLSYDGLVTDIIVSVYILSNTCLSTVKLLFLGLNYHEKFSLWR